MLLFLGLKKNLLLVSTLEDNGYTPLFKQGHVFIYLVGMHIIEVVLLGDQRNRMYVVQGKPMYQGYGWILDSKIIS